MEELAESIGAPRAGIEQLARTLLPDLASLFEADRAALYTLSPGEGRLEIGEFHGHRLPETVAAAMNRALARTPLAVFQYNPIVPEPSQRNVARVVPGKVNDRPATAEIVAEHPLFAREDQLRILVCEGDTLLAWVGLFRSGPYTERERRLFGRLAAPLRQRLEAERWVASGPLASAGLEAALSHIGAPAALVDRRGRVRHANAAARAHAAADPARHAERMRRAVAGADPDFRVTRLALAGLSPHFLVVERPPPADPGARAAALRQRWSLTPRQAAVLAEVALGRTNKAIAASLGIAEGTVELHVTALLQRSESESRAQLVARFWTEG